MGLAVDQPEPVKKMVIRFGGMPRMTPRCRFSLEQLTPGSVTQLPNKFMLSLVPNSSSMPWR